MKCVLIHTREDKYHEMLILKLFEKFAMVKFAPCTEMQIRNSIVHTYRMAVILIFQKKYDIMNS